MHRRKQLFTSVSIVSLRTGDEIEQLKFANEIQEICTGYGGLLIITFHHEIQVYDTANFNRIFTIEGKKSFFGHSAYSYRNFGKSMPTQVSDKKGHLMSK